MEKERKQEIALAIMTMVNMVLSGVALYIDRISDWVGLAGIVLTLANVGIFGKKVKD